MKKCRIIERIRVDKKIEYVIQQKHWLFIWWWVDAWKDDLYRAAFNTLEEAMENLRYFDGTKAIEKIIIEN